ncbi:unnamed protein product [Hymenolepis diminuta]|uniref:Pentatricopeptide repeat-containing protein n=1 Tax=Hymenolepis diminuta TaxID=6216 RepID=A0A0R3SPC0_HYMDI|nr:unnamed protein product [Hymenolepis diminuta]
MRSKSVNEQKQIDRIGGRVRAIKYKERGELYESGGAIFTSNNKYMHMLANEFRLELRQHPPPHGALCLYNGFLAPPSFSTKDGPLRLNRISFAWKYGIDFLRFKIAVSRHVNKFSRIYEKQKNREAFQCPFKMLSSISEKFVMMVESSFEKWLDKHLKLSKQFCNEVAYGFVAQCYCSDLKVHAFAGKFLTSTKFTKCNTGSMQGIEEGTYGTQVVQSMTASSGLCAALYSIVGGNEQIAQNLAAKALCSNPQGFPRPIAMVNLGGRIQVPHKSSSKAASPPFKSGAQNDRNK